MRRVRRHGHLVTAGTRVAGEVQLAFSEDQPRDEHGRWTETGGGGGGGGGEGEHVAAVFDRPAGKPTFHSLKPSGSQRFHDAITAAKSASKYGSSVHAYPVENYSQTRMFMTPDGLAGFALKGNDIVSGFKHPDSPVGNFTEGLLSLATQLGGRKLDAFDTELPRLYGDNGFRAVARLAWDDKEAPAGWDKATYQKYNNGEPDVVFMVHDPEYAQPYKLGDGIRAATYDEAVALQEQALQALSTPPKTKSFIKTGKATAMPMKPHKDESQSEFMSRCVPDMIGSGPDKRPKDQAVAACLTIWRDSSKASGPGVIKQSGDAPYPEDDESESDFMDRCTQEVLDDNPNMDEDQAAEMCSIAWEERKPKQESIVHKTHSAPAIGREFILSDESLDRMGDVIDSKGWDLRGFKSNPVCLFNHNASFVIGRWNNVRVDGKVLRGHLDLAPEGTSDRIDEIRRLVDAGILRAVSVGFRPLQHEPLDKNNPDPWAGRRFLKQELVECSLVGVPANANAISVARSLNVSRETMDVVFAKPGSANERLNKRRGLTGKSAEMYRKRKTNVMSLARRIQDSEQRLVALKDQLTEHMKTVDDTNVSDAQVEVTHELTAKLAQEEKGLSALRDAERHLAATTTANPQGDGGGNELVTRNGSGLPRPFAVPAQKVPPQDYVWRTLVCQVKAHVQKKPIMQVLKETYGDDEPTRAVMGTITRAAALPADTLTSGWASNLVETSIQDFFGALMPASIYPQLAAKGGRFTFGRAGIVSMPTRATTPTIAGSFVAQGAPIPVRQGAFTSVVLTPKKMGVISTFTREIAEHSTPAIEGLIRQAIVEDTGVSIDTVLLDANPATTTRPAGLKNGVAAITATAGAGMAAVVGDLRALTSALISSTSGNLRAPVWILNPGDVLAIALTPAVAGGGEFPFKAELAAGTLLGYPVIQSTTMAADTMMLLDAADFVTATGDEPRFDVSDQALLHMEDTVPLQIVTGAQGSGVVASPARSLWQTDTIGVRMLLDCNWALRRTGVVAWTQTMTWN